MTHPVDNFDKLSQLAQIAFTEAEGKACLSDLERMIDMIDTMNAVDTEGVSPLAHPLDETQRLRPDTVTEQVERDRYQKLAPHAAEGLYLVPRVLD